MAQTRSTARLRIHRIWICVGICLVVVVVQMVWAFLHPPMRAAATCPAILLQIDDAVTMWALKKGKKPLDQPTAAMLENYFAGHRLPSCPQGGQIQLGTLTLATTCSIHGSANDSRPSPQKPWWYDYVPFASRPRPRNPCINCLRQIDSAKQQWALENKKKSLDVPTGSEVAIYFKNNEMLRCPSGGKYVIGAVKDNPICTRSPLGHRLPDASSSELKPTSL